MSTPQALRNLATVIEGFDAAEITVDDVRTSGERSADEGSLTADLTVRIPWGAAADLNGAVSISLPDGTDVDGKAGEGLAVPLSVEIAADGNAARSDRSADVAKARVTDGGIQAPVKPGDSASAAPERSGERTNEPPSEPTASAESESDEDAEPDRSADGGESTPPHRDPERLRAVYESHETFAEMTEALGATVTPQTVRNQMIKRGIHQPNCNRDSGTEDESDDPNAREPTERDTAADRDTDDSEGEGRANGAEFTASGEESPAVDLPSHVTLDDVGEAVREATTLYEVQRTLRIDRSRTRRLLQELDLLDLVSGRMATADERKEAVDEIDERIRRACA